MAIEVSELVNTLKSFSREEWQQIDKAKESALSPTEEDIVELKEFQETDELLKLRNILALKYSMNMSGTPDKKELVKLVSDWFVLNWNKLKQFIGGDDSINLRLKTCTDYINDDANSIAHGIRVFLKLLYQYPVQ